MTDLLSAATIAARVRLDLPALSDPLTVHTFEDRLEDGFGLFRTDTSPAVVVAVIHDGSDSAVKDADDYARLLKLAPVMLALLVDALGAWEAQFDGCDETDDLSVPGGDLVDVFAHWRLRVRTKLANAADGL